MARAQRAVKTAVPTASAAYKKKVAEVALDLAIEHDWCSVVHEALKDRLGIGYEFWPPLVFVQEKVNEQAEWTDLDEDGECMYADDRHSIANAEDRVQNMIRSRAYQGNYAITQRIDFNGKDEKAAKEAALEAVQKYIQGQKALEYPKYRVVRRTNGKDEWLAGDDEPEVKVAKKTAAKKTAAKKAVKRAPAKKAVKRAPRKRAARRTLTA